ncbi:MAG TPA: hypothetical protein PLU50_03835 [Pseudobdellovibrionaceae bacterium]|nr:hypothetical protein [Pseudobdellovibrionaceae bacterium]
MVWNKAGYLHKNCKIAVIIAFSCFSHVAVAQSFKARNEGPSCIPQLVGTNVAQRLEKLNALHAQEPVAEFRLSDKHTRIKKYRYFPIPSVFSEHRRKVVEVFSLDRSSHSKQLVMRVTDLIRMFPELVSRMLSLINETKRTKYECLFAAYILRDIPTQKYRIFVGDLATSNSDYKVESETTNVQTNIDGKNILRHIDHSKTEILELWMIHSHPQVFLPLSAPDLEFTDPVRNEALEVAQERPPLTLRMLAVAGDFYRKKDLVIFSSTYIPTKQTHHPVFMTDAWTHEELGLEK